MPNPADRRRNARVEVLGKVQGRVVSLKMPVTVREMSLGGMSIETSTAFEVGSTTDFLLTLGDGAGVEVYGRVVYTKPIAHDTEPRYISGIQFIDQGEADPEGPVGGLISKAR
jgi:Tfp pilus assembly protein PilZ